jgi:hypothetical protein
VSGVGYEKYEIGFDNARCDSCGDFHARDGNMGQHVKLGQQNNVDAQTLQGLWP